MKHFISSAAFAAGVSAAALSLPRATPDQCCFGLNVNGGHQSGSLGQLDDGQNRVGPGFGGANYCLSSGTIYDSKGYACVIAMPQTQFQCDLNGAPTPGFSVTSSGYLAYNGNTTFYECAATVDMQFNIYTTPYESYCAPITLSTTSNTCNSTSTTCSAVTNTITQVSVATVTASVTFTVPANTVTVTGAGQTVTQIRTVSAPANTVTVTGGVQTVVNTISEVCTPVTTYITLSGAGQTVVQDQTVQQTVTKTVQQTVAMTQTAQLTVVSSAPAATVTVTAPGTTVTVTQTAPGTTIVSGTTLVQTQTQTASTTLVQIQTQTASTTVVPTTTILSSSTIQSSTTSQVSSSASPSSTSCAPNLNGTYQYPHLIIPVSSASPNTAYGTQYFGYINSQNSTIFNFDIPSSYSGETCSLIFLLPLKSQLETSDYTLSGSGSVEVLQLSSPATSSTTYANQPSVSNDLGAFSLTAGSSTVIATTACAAGQTVSYELKATGDYSLTFFEDWNPSPLGLFVRAC